jgi:hypothetical protein
MYHIAIRFPGVAKVMRRRISCLHCIGHDFTRTIVTTARRARHSGYAEHTYKSGVHFAITYKV